MLCDYALYKSTNDNDTDIDATDIVCHAPPNPCITLHGSPRVAITWRGGNPSTRACLLLGASKKAPARAAPRRPRLSSTGCRILCRHGTRASGRTPAAGHLPPQHSPQSNRRAPVQCCTLVGQSEYTSQSQIRAARC